MKKHKIKLLPFFLTLALSLGKYFLQIDLSPDGKQASGTGQTSTAHYSTTARASCKLLKLKANTRMHSQLMKNNAKQMWAYGVIFWEQR